MRKLCRKSVDFGQVSTSHTNTVDLGPGVVGFPGVDGPGRPLTVGELLDDQVQLEQKAGTVMQKIWNEAEAADWFNPTTR